MLEMPESQEFCFVRARKIAATSADCIYADFFFFFVNIHVKVKRRSSKVEEGERHALTD
jgi:hypothetical protein